ncbi:endonuclease/exonuclease/phosphatase family protein [Mucilaginibacter sp. JRF]|uniref:endonuclease/exonuclease/phosphatase family protein n=1 Tax=Mucilaginibacter sp. JRF TaxID=2780088 RepID=UPI0018821C2A|nr:endonuclease/exonuclease/phosphatase family protein [Mucilaginibacter sp. JRF]MBE9586625.1 endonuclease/exonuclease/phosphatase family protein [Mucilaginibacter sp. JRF]
MPFYHAIKANTPEGKRTITKLQVLRKQLAAEIPEKQMESNLLLGTWNIREFGGSKYGGRISESYYYIAEIISKFDIIAVQEVRDNLKALDKVMNILGNHWSYMFTDVTEGRQGNSERTAFLFDTRKVRFGGLAGQLVLPPFEEKDPVSGQTIYKPVKQLARTPFICGFKAGWTDFTLTTVHILYGESTAEDPERVKEIEDLAQMIAQKAEKATAWSHNMILLGDFNIFKREDKTYEAITKAGFITPEALQKLPSNALKNKFYDQIAFRVRPNKFETTGKAGVFDFFKSVFKDDETDEHEYADEMGKGYMQNSEGEPKDDKAKRSYYKTYWRTFQMSDHLPMWVEIRIDHTDNYLQKKLLPPQTENTTTDTPALPVTDQ